MTENQDLPPVKECGSEDVTSFKPLAKALRSDPAFSSKSSPFKIDAKNVAKLVSNLRMFQRIFLGKDAPADIEPHWPLVRLPDNLFRDRSTSGPLFVICSSAYQYLKETKSTTFDLGSIEQYEDNVSLMERIESDLLEAGLLQKPAVYWDETVPFDVRPGLESILEKFGGNVVTDHRHATHVVAHDPEADSSEVLDDESKHDEEGVDLEKKFLRTEAIVKARALVHWWYWPTSFDEWLSSADVDGEILDPPPRPPGGPWVVSCKFIRDVARFNEWGTEADYAIADYQEKVALYKKAAGKSASRPKKKAKTKKKKEKSETPEASDADVEMSDTASSSNVKRNRLGGQGMNPRFILTGHGKSRHLVHDGALRISSDADDIVEHLIRSSSCGAEDADAGKKKQFDLPAIGSVLPPTRDKSLGTITVTELSAVPVPLPTATPGGVQTTAPSITTRTVAINRRIDLTKLIDNTTERIRGGGGEGESASIPGASEVNTNLPVPLSLPPGTGTVAPLRNEAAPTALPTNAPLGGQTNFQPTTRPEVTTATIQPPAQAPGPPPVVSSTPAPGSAVTSTVSTNVVTNNAQQQQGSTLPSSVGSNTKVSSAHPAPKTNQVVPLSKRPLSQWEQDRPGAGDEMPQDPPQFKTARPSWYDSKTASDFEKKMLPEWFDGSAPHRTPATYKAARESMIRMSEQLGNRYVTFTVVRRTITGDAGSLLRLHNFMLAWGFINDDAINDSAPTAQGLRDEAGATWRSSGGEDYASYSTFWTAHQRNNLVEAVVQQSNKRQKITDGSSIAPLSVEGPAFAIDWCAVAEQMGNDVTSDDCEREFLSLPLDDKTANTSQQVERSITPDNTGEAKTSTDGENKGNLDSSTKRRNREEVLRELVDGARPEVVKAATEAALKATGNLAEAQKASVLGIVASQATACAQKEEENVNRVLTELLEQRMLKLENRAALLDDMEGMLEAERVALELERRDLYTSRCRHWFSGGS